MESLAKRLIDARTKKEWTQEDLAKKAKIRQSFIGALESGAQKTSGYLPEIAHVLGVDAYWLKTGKGKRTVESGQAAMEPFAAYGEPLTADEQRLVAAFRAGSDQLRAGLLAMAGLAVPKELQKGIGAPPETRLTVKELIALIRQFNSNPLAKHMSPPEAAEALAIMISEALGLGGPDSPGGGDGRRKRLGKATTR